MPAEFFGGCVCGDVRYKRSAAPIAMVNCHCRDCQKFSGAAFTTNVIVPAAAFDITTGEPSFYEYVTESGNVGRRSFCGRCGARLFTASSGGPEYVGINAGSLDDPSWYEPIADMWLERAQPWVRISPNTTKFQRNPPLPGAS